MKKMRKEVYLILSFILVLVLAIFLLKANLSGRVVDSPVASFRGLGFFPGNTSSGL